MALIMFYSYMNGQCIYDLIDGNVANDMREKWFLVILIKVCDPYA